MKILLYITAFLLFTSCEQKQAEQKIDDKKIIQSALDDWHKAAAEANYTNYFNAMSKDAVFIGTDPTENWQLNAFQTFAKPYFDKGKAWSFTSVERHIYLSDDKGIAWFDELLSTQMKLCRGSGVLKKENGQWKILKRVDGLTNQYDYQQ